MATTVPAKLIFESTFFPDVDEDEKVLSDAFLSESHVIVDFLGMLGRLFTPIKADVNGHIERVRTRFR